MRRESVGATCGGDCEEDMDEDGVCDSEDLASVSSMFVVFAIVQVRFTSAVVQTSLRVIAIAKGINWMPLVCAEVIARQTRMAMEFAITCATTSPRVIVTAKGINWTLSVCAVEIAFKTRTAMAFVMARGSTL